MTTKKRETGMVVGGVVSGARYFRRFVGGCLTVLGLCSPPGARSSSWDFLLLLLLLLLRTAV